MEPLQMYTKYIVRYFNDERVGIQSRRDCVPKSKFLIDLEERIIIRHIRDLDSRGVSPRMDAVRDVANKLLAERGAGQELAKQE